MKKLVSLLIALSLLLVSLTFATPVKAVVAPISISYQAYVSPGWQSLVPSGTIAGTIGKSLRLEAIKINLVNAPSGSIVKYMVHIFGGSWQTAKTNGELAGIIGSGKVIDAFIITLENIPGYSAEYQAYIRNVGWQTTRSNGEIAGTINQTSRIEAFKIKMVKISDNTDYNVIYETHTRYGAWQPLVSNGQISGTVDLGNKIDDFTIKLANAPLGARVKYQAHNAKTGWLTPVYSGAASGTTRRGILIEAFNATLENMPGSSIQYRVRAAGIGWQPWASNGATAGNINGIYIIEAIEVRIVSNPLVMVLPTSLTLNKTTETLNVGSSVSLIPTILPTNASVKNVLWTSSNTTVATVSATGVVTAISAGTSSVTATTIWGNVSTSCVVTVVVPVTSITVTGAATVVNGQALQLGVTIAPSNATDQTIVWTVATFSGGTATIDANGLLSATGAGFVIVTATNVVSGVAGIKIIQVNQNSADIATVAVVTAEVTPTQVNIDIAQGLVTALPSGTIKTELQGRIDIVQGIINLATAKITAHEVLATALLTYNAGDYTAPNWAALNGYKTAGDTAIDAATDLAGVSSAQSIATIGMDSLQTIAESEIAATAAVVIAETTPSQVNVDTAQGLVTALPNGATRTTLQGRIDVVQIIVTLNVARVAAHNALTTTLAMYISTDYSTDNWTTLTGFKTAGDTAIDAALDLVGVSVALNTATLGMDGVATIAETLVAAKVVAHSVLTTALGTYTSTDYTTGNWTTLTGFKTAGDTAIDAATTLAEVTSAQTTATVGMAGVAKDLADAKVAAHSVLTTALGTYTSTDYTTGNWTALTGFKTAGDAAIDVATTLADVTTAQNTATVGMASVAKDLADAKVAAHGVLTTVLGMYTSTDYTTGNWTTLTGFKTAGDAAIDVATTLADVTSAQSTAIVGMANVQTIAEAVLIATSAVETAEATPTQVNVDTAQGLVTALQTGATKTALQSRIDVVQSIIDATLAAENAILALEAVDWTIANQAAVTQGMTDAASARLLVDATPISAQFGFNIRLDDVDAMLAARQAILLLIPSTIVFADGIAIAKLTTDTSFTNVVSGDGSGAITYSSGTPATATVNATTGEVTILAVGTTVITAVKARTATHEAVTNSYTLTVRIPSTIIFADVAPSKGTDIATYKNNVTGVGTGAITYSSSTPATATVNSTTGTVTILAVGTTTITAVKAATATHASVTNSYVLTVFVPVTVTLNKNTTSMLLGNSDTLIATVMPVDAIDKSVVWSVVGYQNPATVVDGLVTGVKLGIATVTVTTVDGRTAQCFVTVTNEANLLNNFNLGRSMTYMPGLITQFGDALGMNLPDYKRMTLDQQFQVQQIMIYAPGFATIADIRNEFDQAVATTILSEINNATIDTIASAITNNATALGLDLGVYNGLSPEQQVIVQGYVLLSPYFGNWYMSNGEVQTAFSSAVSNASAAETALATINAATVGTIENALTSNAALLGLNVDSYILYGDQNSLNLSLVDLVFTNAYDLQVAIDTIVMAPVNAINVAMMDTIATAITDNATSLGLDLGLYNALSLEQQVIVQGYLVFTTYYVSWYISIAEVQASFNTAVSNAMAAETALAEISNATEATIELAITSNATLLGLSLVSYDPLTMNANLVAQDFTNTFDLQIALGW